MFFPLDDFDQGLAENFELYETEAEPQKLDTEFENLLKSYTTAADTQIIPSDGASFTDLNFTIESERPSSAFDFQSALLNSNSHKEDVTSLDPSLFFKDLSQDLADGLVPFNNESDSHCESNLSLTGDGLNLSYSDNEFSPRNNSNNKESMLLTPPSTIGSKCHKEDSYMDLLILDFDKKGISFSTPSNSFLLLNESFSLGSSGVKESTSVSKCASDDSFKDGYNNRCSRNKLKRKRSDCEDYEDASYKATLSGVKPIPARFKTTGFVTLEESTTQCLDVDINYHNYTGKIRKVIINNDITNSACQEHDSKERRSSMLESIFRAYRKHPQEEFWGNCEGEIGFESGVLQRKIHVRDISEITDMVSSVLYEASPKFNENIPYEPQYFRYELDENNNIVGESKCGLCAFCPEVKFYPFKNSSYLSHMTLMHGVFANNYVVPEGIYVGKYKLNRTSYSRKKNIIEALQCPVCFQIIPIKCWKTKKNPLLSYFRHFKKQHQKESRTFIDSVIDPVRFELL